MDIFPEYYSPYFFALAFVALIGIVEIVSLFFGNVISGVIDSHLGDYDGVASGHLNQFFHYLILVAFPHWLSFALSPVASACLAFFYST